MICRSRGPTWSNFSSIKLHLTDTAPVAQVAKQPGRSAQSVFGSLRLILHSRGQIGPGMLTNCKKPSCATSNPVKRGYYSVPQQEIQCFPEGTTDSFAQHLG